MILPFDLQCEYAVDPVGIDARKPRFSWLLQAEERGQSQSAYQVLVASSEGKLLAGAGDKWDSGQVASADMAHVVYGGAALESNEHCWWAVQVWDQEGRASGFQRGGEVQHGAVGGKRLAGQLGRRGRQDDLRAAAATGIYAGRAGPTGDGPHVRAGLTGNCM